MGDRHSFLKISLFGIYFWNFVFLNIKMKKALVWGGFVPQRKKGPSWPVTMKKGRRFICRGPLQPTVAAAAGRSWQVAQSTRFCPTSYSWTRVTLEVLYKHGAEKETTDRSCTCVVSIKTGSSHQIIRGSVNPLGRIALLIFIPFCRISPIFSCFLYFFWKICTQREKK